MLSTTKIITVSLLLLVSVHTSLTMNVCKAIIQSPSVQIVAGVAVGYVAGSLVKDALFIKSLILSKQYCKYLLYTTGECALVAACSAVPVMRLGSGTKLESSALLSKAGLCTLVATSFVSLFAGIHQYRKYYGAQAINEAMNRSMKLQVFGLPLALTLVMGVKRYMATR